MVNSNLLKAAAYMGAANHCQSASEHIAAIATNKDLFRDNNVALNVSVENVRQR